MWIKWSNSADNDLAEILSHLSSLGKDELGKDIIRSIFKSTDRLISYPMSGRPGRIAGTREIINTTFPYVIIYRIMSNRTVRILRVIHTSRLFPEIL